MGMIKKFDFLILIKLYMNLPFSPEHSPFPSDVVTIGLMHSSPEGELVNITVGF